MTKQEFIDRTGLKDTSDLKYSFIECIYMASGNMDKDRFCECYTEKSFPIMQEMEKIASNNELELRNAINNRNAAGRKIADKAFQYYDLELRDEAIAMLGEKKYLCYQLDNKQLMEPDIKLLKSYLQD